MLPQRVKRLDVLLEFLVRPHVLARFVLRLIERRINERRPAEAIHPFRRAQGRPARHGQSIFQQAFDIRLLGFGQAVEWILPRLQLGDGDPAVRETLPGRGHIEFRLFAPGHLIKRLTPFRGHVRGVLAALGAERLQVLAEGIAPRAEVDRVADFLPLGRGGVLQRAVDPAGALLRQHARIRILVEIRL